MKTSIKRVVSSFILSGRGGNNNHHRDDVRVAVFHRVDTMPTFPGHWAPCSGSVEVDDASPWHAARRELHEETNLWSIEPNQPGGRYVDVPFRENTIIRVYPFTVNMPSAKEETSTTTVTLELLGTEHDHYKFVSISELERLEPAVPGLARAFHHATWGRYLAADNLPPAAQDWAADHENGAAVMAQNALRLVSEHGVDPNILTMLRPTMVAISNALTALVVPVPPVNRILQPKEQDGNKDTSSTSPTADQVLQMLQDDARASVEFAVQTIQPWVLDHEQKQQQQSSSSSPEPYVIATHSRSSTVLQILERLVDEGIHQHPHSERLRILCGQSTPGDEGLLMAQDLVRAGAKCVPDSELQETIRNGTVHLLLVGCDCLTDHEVVNKVGTKLLVQLARETTTATATTGNCATKIVCCVDRWKVWDDIFPPPLEEIFECIPRERFDFILLPPQPTFKSQCEAPNVDG